MKPANIEVNIESIGLIGGQPLQGALYLSGVRDLVDIIQLVESMHSILRKVEYHVNVNGLRTERNQQINPGDKIVIRTMKESGGA